MQAYTLAEIGKNLAASPIPKRETNHTSSYLRGNTPSKFKPKVPAQRYAERHPEDKYLETRDMGMDLDGPYEEDEMDDDAEYIIDTYIRMPADALETENLPKNIGFLVLDSQPDIDAFYQEEEDSDEEEDDLDEDENGIASHPLPFPKFNLCMLLLTLYHSGEPLYSRLPRRRSRFRRRVWSKRL